MVPWFTKFAPNRDCEKRHLGDAGSALRLFPVLEDMSLGSPSLQDLSFVTALPKLRKLHLSSSVLEDLEQLRQYGALRHQEEGETPDPEDFVPPDEIRPESYRRAAPVPATPGGDDESEDNPDFELKPFDEQEQNSDAGNDDDDSNVTTAPPPEPPDDFWDDPYAHPLASSYRFYARLTFEALYHDGGNIATLQQLLGRLPDEFYPAPKADE